MALLHIPNYTMYTYILCIVYLLFFLAYTVQSLNEVSNYLSTILSDNMHIGVDCTSNGMSFYSDMIAQELGLHTANQVGR